MKWDSAADQKLLLAIMKVSNPKVDWARVASIMECTPKAISHRMTNIKAMAGSLPDGTNTPPATPAKRRTANPKTPKSTPKKAVKRERDTSDDSEADEPMPKLDFKKGIKRERGVSEDSKADEPPRKLEYKRTRPSRSVAREKRYVDPSSEEESEYFDPEKEIQSRTPPKDDEQTTEEESAEEAPKIKKEKGVAGCEQGDDEPLTPPPADLED